LEQPTIDKGKKQTNKKKYTEKQTDIEANRNRLINSM
jgi:hypothetical protein